MPRLLVVVALLASSAPAFAEDPNRWQGWVTPKDGQDNGIDVSMVSGNHKSCGKKGFVQLTPRYRNRYQDHTAGKLKIEYEGTDGAASALAEFDLQIGDTKVTDAAAFCHDSKKSLAFSIAELRFPERDAERAKLAAQKEAAEKAAAAEAAARKAAADKAAAEAAAAAEARKEQAKKEAERLAKEGEAARAQDAKKMRAGERESAESRQRQAAAEQYQEARAREAQFEAERNVPRDELATEKFRVGEVSIAAPIGFQHMQYRTNAVEVGRFSYGLRADLRFFAWLKKTNARGQPPTGNGLEFSVGGGYATTIALGSQTSTTKTTIAGGTLRARFWLGSFGVGLVGDWTRYAFDPGMGMPTETHNLFALSPELAFGIVASRAIALEASVRAGAVASGNGLTFSSGDDMFVGASVIAELNKLYAGAYATRYVTSSGVESSWNAMGMIGVRLAF